MILIGDNNILSTKNKRHKEIIKKIQNLMIAISNDLLINNKIPSLEISKLGYDNTFWSEKKKMLTLGEKKVIVSPSYTKKIPTFSQYLVMANAIRKLVDEEMESTIRGMYYATLSTVGDETNKEKFWRSQEDSDDAIKAVELITGIPREEFSVTSKPKGMISGPITLSVGGDIIDCNLGSRATSQLIPTNISDVEIVDVKADFVMVVEKDTVLNNIRKSGFIQKYNAKVLGMMFSDIYDYNIPEVARLASTAEDINRANDMKKKPWLQEKQWQKELNLFLKKREKCELDAFFKHGFKYLAEQYLPRKLREAGVI